MLLQADGLSTGQVQAIAAEFSLSETAFLGTQPAPGASWPLQIFTPKVELPFAGHPTIGTAFALASAGMLRSNQAETSVMFQEGAGPVTVRIGWRYGQPETATLTVAGPAEEKPASAKEDLAEVLGLSAEEIGIDRHAVGTVSLGVPFTLVPVRGRPVLARAQVDQQAWQQLLAGTWAPHLYVFTDDAERPGADIRARMFAPAMGIAEDPATGAAASTLAGDLAGVTGTADGSGHWRIEQGIEMGRPSRLEIAVRWRGGNVVAVDVGGAAVNVGEGHIRIPAADR